jgi:uncharacterized protein
MKELLELIVQGIVNNPEEVTVVERESVDFPGLIILEVEVADSDKGILIGRRGRTINSIRDLITISAIRHDKRVKVLVKDDGKRPERQGDAKASSGEGYSTKSDTPISTQTEENSNTDESTEETEATDAPEIGNEIDADDILNDEM